jgi:hypothetical protein
MGDGTASRPRRPANLILPIHAQPEEVADTLRRLGYEPVWKDWECSTHPLRALADERLVAAHFAKTDEPEPRPRNCQWTRDASQFALLARGVPAGTKTFAAQRGGRT